MAIFFVLLVEMEVAIGLTEVAIALFVFSAMFLVFGLIAMLIERKDSR